LNERRVLEQARSAGPEGTQFSALVTRIEKPPKDGNIYELFRNLNVHDKVQEVLLGGVPDRIPFIGRMDFWYRGLNYQGKIPEQYHGMSLSEIHQAIGFGQEEWLSPCAYKTENLELIMSYEGREILHEYEPEISFLPGPVGEDTGRPGRRDDYRADHTILENWFVSIVTG